MRRGIWFGAALLAIMAIWSAAVVGQGKRADPPLPDGWSGVTNEAADATTIVSIRP